MRKYQTPSPFFFLFLSILCALPLFFSCVTTQQALHFDQGNEYLDKNQYDQAISEYTKVIEINPRLVNPYFNRGIAYTIKGQYDQAISDFTKALEINPRYAEAYNNRGVALQKKGEYDKALEDFNRAQNLGYQVSQDVLNRLRGPSENQRAFVVLPMNEYTFQQEFSKALKAKNQARMEELVKETDPHIVYNGIISEAVEGIRAVAARKNKSIVFNTAEAMARTFAKEFKKDGLLELVAIYRQYSQKMCKENLKAGELIAKGNSILESQPKEAFNTYKEALKMFAKLRDAEMEARTLYNIGLAYERLGQYQEVLNNYKQSLEIKRRLGDVAKEASTLEDIGNTYQSLGQNDEAMNYHKQSFEMKRKIKDMKGQADSLIVIGNICNLLSKNQEALSYYKQSLEVSRKSRDAIREANSLSNIGTTYLTLAQYQEALSYYKQSLEISRRSGDAEGEIRDLNNIGYTHDRLFQYHEALSYHKQSLEVSRKSRDPEREANSLSNIANTLFWLAQYQEALNYYNQSLEISRRMRDTAGECGLLNNIGNVYQKLGRYHESLNYYKQSLEISRRIGDADGELSSLINMATFYNTLGQRKEALNYRNQYKKGVENLFKRDKELYKSAQLLSSVSNIFGSNLNISELDPNQFLNDYYLFLAMARHVGNLRDEADLHMLAGKVNFNNDKYREALNYGQKAFEIWHGIGDAEAESRSLVLIGLAYAKLGQNGEAVRVLRESVKISEHVSTPNSILVSNIALGRTLWESGKSEEAVAYYKKAMNVIEELYRYSKGLKEEERSSMIGEMSTFIEEYIELLLELHGKYPGKGYEREVFVISEKGKSRIFQEMMTEAGAKISFAGDEDFKKTIAKEQQLMGQVTKLRGHLSEELSKPEKEKNQEVLKSLESQLSSAEKIFTDIEKEIELKYPRYADLRRPKPLTVEELQRVLGPDETVVSYAVGKEKTAVFLISKRVFKLVELGIKKEDLSKLVKGFRKGLENITALNQLKGFEPDIAYKLYQKLLQPLYSDLKGITKLYLSADDLLYTLPFEVLVDKEVDLKIFSQAKNSGTGGSGAYLMEYGTLHYLIDTYTITYLPSASVLRSLRKYEKPGYGKWVKPLIAFADPIFSVGEMGAKSEVKGRKISSDTELSIQILTRSIGGGELPRLSESAQEAEAIASELRARKEDIYLRDKASEENVYKTTLNEARYLLFSTHGLLGGEFRGVAEPSLALTLIDNPPGRDGFLATSEVLGLDLNSELVILSACNTTGKGDKAGSGEGFAGLTRSFMYAGSKALLVTHWGVESEAARDLMVETFRNVNNRDGWPEALRKAKLGMKGSVRQVSEEMLAARGIRLTEKNSGKKAEKLKFSLSLSHPFFWGPFVLVGEGN